MPIWSKFVLIIRCICTNYKFDKLEKASAEKTLPFHSDTFNLTQGEERIMKQGHGLRCCHCYLNDSGSRAWNKLWSGTATDQKRHTKSYLAVR